MHSPVAARRRCNAIFSPRRTEIAHARRVAEAYDAALASGRGAASLDGEMIDEANMRMARVVLDQIARRQMSDG